MTAKTILLVEDNADELMIYSTLLSHHGYLLITASNVADALELVRKHRPSCAVVDIDLGAGELDGTDFVEAIRADAHLRDIPVVIHSAFVDIHGVRLRGLDANDVVPKPTHPSALLVRIERLISAASA